MAMQVQKANCILCFYESKSVITVQSWFWKEYGLNPCTRLSIYAWYKQFTEWFCLPKLRVPACFWSDCGHSAGDVHARLVKVDKICQLGTHHSSASGVENCRESFAVEMNQLTCTCCPVFGMRMVFIMTCKITSEIQVTLKTCYFHCADFIIVHSLFFWSKFLKCKGHYMMDFLQIHIQPSSCIVCFFISCSLVSYVWFLFIACTTNFESYLLFLILLICAVCIIF